MNETPDLEAVRQEHEFWLAELEGLAVEAIASYNWDAFYAHVVDFQNEHDLHGETGIAIAQNLTVRFLKLEASADTLDGVSADLLPPTQKQQRLGDFQSCQILNLNSHRSKQS